MQAISTPGIFYCFRSLCLWIFFSFCLGLGLQDVSAQQIAFPGAEGAGKFTSGGRGTPSEATTIFEVTKLEDDGTAGTLRWALTQAATYRTIVFRISGTIHLNSKLTIRSNTTIAGQTAPGDGVCIADHPTVISGDNVIVRYIRFRMGDKNQNKGKVDSSGGDDTFSGMENKNVIIDHCSISWSSDEALTIYRGDQITLQWNIISEPLNYSYHYESPGPDFQEHGYGGIWGGQNASFHHNLIAHAKGRMPRFSGSGSFGDGKTAGLENVDFRNNVVYNWGSYSTNGGEGGNYNVVNNYYKYGPSVSSGSTSGVDRRYMIMNPSKSDDLPFPKIYLDGNYVDGSTSITQHNWKGIAMASAPQSDTVLSKVNTPFNLPAIVTQSALEAYEMVLVNAGVILPNRDDLDQRIISDVRNRTGKIIDVQGGFPHGTPYAQTINAWPVLNSAAAPADSDKDGMPDSWETAKGLNPNDASDRNIYDATGYTMLEVYLNSLANASNHTNPSVFVNGTPGNFSQTAGTPSAAQTLLVSGVNLTGNISITPPAHYEISVDGATWYGNAQSLVLTHHNGIVATTTLSIRLNASVPGSFTGNILFASNGATSSMSVALNGTTVSAAASNPGVIGVFPDMDGGFEKQSRGLNTTIGTTPNSHTSTSSWASNASFAVSDSVARTGALSMHFRQESTSNKYVFTPVLTSPKLQPSTGYVVQFWYRIPYQLTKNDAGSKDLKISGFSTVNGAVGGTSTAANSTFTSQTAIVNKNTPFGSDWILFRGALTSPADGGGLTYSGIRIAYPQNPNFDMDDFVVYPGTAFDETAPDAVTSPTASGSASNNTITVNWSAPATGVDDGGYVVVRSTSATTPVPNTNGIYAIGNTMGAGNTIVYTGVLPSFTDNGSVDAIAPGTIYYYHIFTVDKGFNYSAPVQVTGSLNSVAAPAISVIGTLNAFAQTVGTSSAAQTFTITGSNLSGAVTITAPDNYQVSFDEMNWSNNLIITSNTSTVATTTIHVRLNASAAGTYAGKITVTSTGVVDQTIAVTGAIIMPPVISLINNLKAFTQTVGTSSMPQTFAITGNYLTGNVTITAPAHFEISVGGGIWTDSTIKLGPTNGVLNATISVRMNAESSGLHNGSISVSSTGINNEDIAVTGIAYSLFTMSPNPAKSFIRIHHPKFYTVGTLTIYNISGFKMGSYYTASSTDMTEIQVSHLTAGIYFIEYRGLKKIEALRFIKE